MGPTAKYLPDIRVAVWPALLALVVVMLSIWYLRAQARKRREAAPKEEGEEGEEVTLDGISEHGLFAFLGLEAESLSAQVVTNKEIRVEELETVYYLVEGEVDVYFRGERIDKKKRDFIVGSTEDLAKRILVKERRPGYKYPWQVEKSAMHYVIKPKSVVYKIDNCINSKSFRFLLYNRFVRGTLDAYFNYFEMSFLEYDVVNIGGDKLTAASTAESIKAHVQEKMRERMIQEREVKSVKIHTNKKLVKKNGTLYYVLEGTVAATVKGRKEDSKACAKGDLIGYLIRYIGIKRDVEIEGEGVVAEIVLCADGARQFGQFDVDGPGRGAEDGEGKREEDASLVHLHAILKDFYLRASPRLTLVDTLIHWRIYDPGDRVLVRTQEVSSVVIVSSGYLSQENSTSYFGIASGSVILEREAVLGKKAEHTIVAIRQSEVIELPRNLIFFMMEDEPRISVGMMRKILEREEHMQEETKSGMQNSSPRIICLLPNDPHETQIETFAYFLNKTMNRDASSVSTVFSSREVESTLGDALYSPQAPILLMSLISQIERQFRFLLVPVIDPASRSTAEIMKISEIIFYVKTSDSNKTLALGRAHCKIDLVVLYREALKNRKSKMEQIGHLFKLGDHKPEERGEMEKRAFQKHNVLFPRIDHLSFTTDSLPGGDGALRDPPSLATEDRGHFRDELDLMLLGVPACRGPKGQAAARTPFLEAPASPYRKFPTEDLERLVRTIKGENIGLVLGGGGARGIAHIGIIQALKEAEIPIDVVGGTSMGAFIGGLYSESCDNKEVFIQAKKFCKMVGSVWRLILDLTYPFCSMFTGTGMNNGLKSIFKNRKIEDQWISFYCVSTDISAFDEKVHRTGYIWRFVRASMSLSGYLPPICDGGSLLMDGGYMNNVPADAMRNMGVRNVIAVDVGTEVEGGWEDYGDSLNGFYIIFQRLFSTKRYLSLPEIQYRLTYISSTKKEKELRNDQNVKYMRPDLRSYKTMDFGKFDEIVAHGYEYGKKVISTWKATGEYERLVKHRKKRERRNSL